MTEAVTPIFASINDGGQAMPCDIQKLKEMSYTLERSGYYKYSDAIDEAIAEIEALRAASVGVNVGVPEELYVDLRNMAADYRLAVSGRSSNPILNYNWTDKPHRLVYDLCGKLENVASILNQPPSEVGVNVGVPPGDPASPPYYSRG